MDEGLDYYTIEIQEAETFKGLDSAVSAENEPSIGVRLSIGRWPASERASQRSNPRFNEAGYLVGAPTGYWTRSGSGINALAGVGCALCWMLCLGKAGVADS